MYANNNVSKIVKYNLEQDTINLRQAGLSYQRIADELNATGKVPEDDPINAEIVKRFLDRVPSVSREMIKRDEKKMLAVVNSTINIITEMTNLYERTKNLLEELEEKSSQLGKPVDPYRFKALSSEMREMLKMMIDIQKELNDYENIKEFIATVIETVYEVAPEAMPIIIERLRLSQRTKWIGQVLRR